MVRLLTALVAALLVCPAAAHAGACGQSFWVGAAGPTLARRGLVLVDVTRDAPLVEALRRTRFVTTRGEATPARIVRIENQQRTQVLLAPIDALPAGAHVHLEVGDPAHDRQLADFTFTTSALEHNPAPRWRSAPRAKQRRIEPSNKGDSFDAIPVQIALEAPAFVVAHIEPGKHTRPSNPPSDAPATVIYAPDKQIEIGDTGCSSMLWLSGRFTATLAALDDDGAETAAPGAALPINLTK